MDFKLPTSNETEMRTLDTHFDMVELLSSPGNSSEPISTPDDTTIQPSEEVLHLDTPKTGKNDHLSPLRPSSMSKNSQEGL